MKAVGLASTGVIASLLAMGACSVDSKSNYTGVAGAGDSGATGSGGASNTGSGGASNTGSGGGGASSSGGTGSREVDTASCLTGPCHPNESCEERGKTVVCTPIASSGGSLGMGGGGGGGGAAGLPGISGGASSDRGGSSPGSGGTVDDSGGSGTLGGASAAGGRATTATGGVSSKGGSTSAGGKGGAGGTASGGSGGATCATACPYLHECIDGQCKCQSGLTDCSGECVQLTSDQNHCGGCGKPCTNGRECIAGVCSCQANAAYCGTACVDTLTDPSHCGGCSKACNVPRACSSGVCECPGGGTLCAGSCVDIATDKANCGACGVACAGAGICEASKCTICKTGCAVIGATFKGGDYASFSLKLANPLNLANATVRARFYVTSAILPDQLQVYVDDERTEAGSVHGGGLVVQGWYDSSITLTSTLSPDIPGVTMIGLNIYSTRAGTISVYVDSITITPALGGPWEFLSSASPLTPIPANPDLTNSLTGTVSWRGP